MLKQNYENLHNINLNQHEEIQTKNNAISKNNLGKGKKEIILKSNKEMKKERELSDSEEELQIKDVNKKNKKFKKSNKKTNSPIKRNIALETIELTEKEKTEIFENNHYIPLIKYVSHTKTLTEFIFKYKSKNFIFYSCKLKDKCKGKGKVNINKKNFIITNYCNNKVKHEDISYEEFIKLYTNKQYKKIKFNEIKIQKYFVMYIISQNKSIDNASIINKFKTITELDLTLSKSTISNLRNSIVDTYKDLDLNQLIEKIKEEHPDLMIYIQDIKYEIFIKNNKEERNERIIYFSKKHNLEYLNKEKCSEFFLDITYNIIPYKFRAYKLLIISGLPKDINRPISIIFILIKYMDRESYNRIFNYLYENFKLNYKN